MLVQICMDYASLPPLHDITCDEIEFFYNPLIPTLVETQKTGKRNKAIEAYQEGQV